MARVEFSEVERWMRANALRPADAARIFGVTSQRMNGWKARGQVSADESDRVRSQMAQHSAGGLREVSPAFATMLADTGSIQIPQLAVAGAMGDGNYPPDHIDVVQYVTARVSELRKQCTFSDPKALQIITGYGRSMLPTFSDGDPLLVDTSVKDVELDAVYAFTFDGKFYIKGLQRIPRAGLRVLSHNRDENEPWDISIENMPLLSVHGRVILAWNTRRL